MHRSKCPSSDEDAPFFTLPIVILTKMKHHFCGRRAILEGHVQPLRRQELDSNVLKYALLDGHIIHCSKLVLTRRC